MSKIEGETDFKQKILQFQEVFFIKHSELIGKNLTNYAYKNVYGTPKKINTYKIFVVIHELLSRLVLGLDNISNEILKITADLIILYIYLMFNICFKVKYYLYYFKNLITIISRKINKENYTRAKFYCLVVLLNTLGKVLEAILAKRLRYLVTEYALLFQIHISRHKNIYTNNEYYYLLEQLFVDKRYVVSKINIFFITSLGIRANGKVEMSIIKNLYIFPIVIVD